MLISILTFFVVLCIHSINSECPPNIIIKPCSCFYGEGSRVHASATASQILASQVKSIKCEQIRNSSFDLRSVFIKLSAYNSLISEDEANATHFNTFHLCNTSVESLPENVFVNVTFTGLIFQDNPQLTTIDRNAFTYLKDKVELLETMNTNLSDSETIFFIIKQLKNLRMLNLQNDRLSFIPSYAFNHTHLSHIYFGMEHFNQSQPIESIGEYAFYNLPNLQFLRIFSPNLREINKYAFAQRRRYNPNDRLSYMLELYLGGQMINSNTFPLTSLTRFRNRFVFLRLYNTSMTYFDEEVFQPFLESNPSSLLDINSSNPLLECDCRSAWIQSDYLKNINQMDIRVYGYKCWEYDFTRNCTGNQ